MARSSGLSPTFRLAKDHPKSRQAAGESKDTEGRGCSKFLEGCDSATPMAAGSADLEGEWRGWCYCSLADVMVGRDPRARSNE